MSMSKRWKAVFWILGLAVAIGLTVFYMRRGQEAAISYKKVRVTRGDLQVTVLSSGVVQPENRLEIKPPIAGRVEEVLVDEGQIVKKGQILAWMSSTERAGLIDAARAKGEQEVKRWEDFYKPSPIVAPIAGTIILRNVEPGQTFTNQEAVLVMSDRLTVKAQVDETDIAQIHLQQVAQITLDAYASQVIPGHVAQLAFEAKTVNNVTTYTIDVLPDQTPDFMKSGMTANITFVVANKTNITLAPSEAIHTKKEGVFVLVRSSDKNHLPTEKKIETGITDGKVVEIIAGLEPNDELLVPELKQKSAQAANPFAPMGVGGRGRSGR
jgi:macrolide-specific efflux system membrane fusion protein